MIRSRLQSFALISALLFTANAALASTFGQKVAGRSTTTRTAGQVPRSIPDLSRNTARLFAPFASPVIRTANASDGDGFAIRARVGRDVNVVSRPGIGTPMLIEGPSLERAVVSVMGEGSDPDLETARRFLRRNRLLLRLDDPDVELRLERKERDTLGRRHLRFGQLHGRLTVWPSELIVHLDPSGNVDLVNGAYVPSPRRIPAKPVVTADRAIGTARTELGFDKGKSSPPELIVYAPLDRTARLAWKFDLSQGLLKHRTVVVDALNGRLLTSFSRVHHANVQGSGIDVLGERRTLNVWQQGTTYYMVDTSKPMYDPTSQPPNPDKTKGAIFVIDARNQPPTDDPQELPDLFHVTSSDPNNWSLRDAVSASFNLSKTYDYYREVHNRNSIDAEGGSITGAVRMGRGMLNAFWLDAQQMMAFGDADRFAASLDVIAHEVTHGVTNRSSNLVYQDQSGALNEAFSDIMGEMTEARVRGANDWRMGSELQDSRLYRSMINPALYQQPSRMSQFVVTREDDGGVHINSGIINHAFYLLTAGSTAPIGRSDAERIFYRAFTTHLVKNSQFIDARLAVIRAAEELFGTGSAQARQTAEAFDAVEVFAAAATPPPPVFNPVTGDDAVFFLRLSGTSHLLFRRDPARGDGAGGRQFLTAPVPDQRVSVTGDGSLMTFVDGARDVCVARTDGSEGECYDLPASGIRASSSAIAPDASVLSIVLLGSNNQPEDEIIVIFDPLGSSPNLVRIPLEAPAQDRDEGPDNVLFADAMDFTSDARFIVYDALSEFRLSDGTSVASWAIYAIDLLDGEFLQVLPPEPELDITYAALSQTSDRYITFEAYDPDTGVTVVAATDTLNGRIEGLVEFRGPVFSVPSYAGDDSAIIYTGPASNTTGSSLFRIPVAADRITPTALASVWLPDAKAGVVYRTGSYSGPSVKPGSLQFSSSTFRADEGKTLTVTVRRANGNKGVVSVSFATTGGSAISGTDFLPVSGTLSWEDGDMEDKYFRVQILGDGITEGTESFGVVLTTATGASLGDPASSTIQIDDEAGTTPPPPPPTTRRRPTRR